MYSRHRFPDEIISYCVWLYYTFPLSYRDIEKIMLYCRIEVTYESIREWCQKFEQQYANQQRAQTSLCDGQMASRRTGSDDQKATIFFVAGSGFGGERAGCLATTTSRHAGGRALLPQIVEETKLCATGDRDRQAQELRSGEESCATKRGTSLLTRG